MGYVRIWRHKQIMPGVRLNVSKSGPSLSFGPRGMHYTVGRRGRRFTAGIPGTGVYYTSYSRSHARSAAKAARMTHATAFSPRPPTTSRREPLLPAYKVALGILLLWIPPLGLTLLIIGLRQRHEPLWVARSLVARARRTPAQAAELLEKARALQPGSPEVLAPLAELQYTQKAWVQSAHSFDEYLDKAPTDWVAVTHCGMAYFNAGGYASAIARFVTLREVAPLAPDSHASVTAHLALAYLHQGDAPQAEALAKGENLRQRMLGDGGQQCLFVRAIARYVAGEHSAAIADLDRLYAMNPLFSDLSETKNAMQAGTFTFIPPTT